MTATLERLNTELSSVVEEASRSLVQVSAGQGSFGAGVVCHAEGLIITNAHVVHESAPQVRLLNGKTFPGRVVALDRERDLAALTVPTGGLASIRLGDSSQVRPGAWVVSLGHPWGVKGAVTAGSVIGMGETGWNGRGLSWLVAAVRLRPGHSGGPMLDAEGRLVGINTMVTGPEVGLAVPVNAVKVFLRETLGAGARAVA